jgi:hypothetical protein
MMRFEVFSQANELAIEKPKVERCRMGIHSILAHRQQPYVSAALFQQCTTIVLIHIDSPRVNDEFALKPVTLLMDDFDIDRRSKVVPTLKENYIRLIFFLPNTIQIYKSLGLRLFDVRKTKMQEKVPTVNIDFHDTPQMSYSFFSENQM